MAVPRCGTVHIMHFLFDSCFNELLIQMGTGIQREGSDKQEHIHKATGQFSKASKGGGEMCTPVLFIIQNIHNEQS